MINEEKLKGLYSQDPKMTAYLFSRKYGEETDEYFNIFKAINNLDIRIALADYGTTKDGESLECCQFVPRNSSERGYIILSNNSSIQRIRFNSAIMLYCALKNQKKIQTYQPGINDKSLHQAKVFAVNLLMPEKELINYIFKKDENGNYVFLDENEEISIDNINYVAAHFGVPFKTCASRILNVTNNIKDIKSKEQLMRTIKSRNYIGDISKEDKKRISNMYAQLINSLRYLKVERTKAITLEKILRECVKNEALLEGVIKNTKGVNYLLQLFANEGFIDSDGNLHSKHLDEPISLNEEQLLVLGNYELLKNIAYQNISYYTNDPKQLIEEAITKAGYGLEKKETKDKLYDIAMKYIRNDITYKDAEDLLTKTCNMDNRDKEKFLSVLLGFDHYTIKSFHKVLFKYSKEQESIRGHYRYTKVIVPSATFDTTEAKDIEFAMESLNYDIIDLLKIKDELSNSEYINKVNLLISRFIMIHPFVDGNGRVSRALTNYLYKKKHLPFIFINADHQRDMYIAALKEINYDDVKFKKPNVDLTDIDLVMFNAIKTSYSNIYSGSKMLTNPEKEIAQSRLINDRK